MNCQSPTAFAFEVTVGLRPDSIIERYFSSSGAPSSARIRSYIGKKRPERASQSAIDLRPLPIVKKSIVFCTASLSGSAICSVSDILEVDFDVDAVAGRHETGSRSISWNIFSRRTKKLLEESSASIEVIFDS